MSHYQSNQRLCSFLGKIIAKGTIPKKLTNALLTVASIGRENIELTHNNIEDEIKKRDIKYIADGIRKKLSNFLLLVDINPDIDDMNEANSFCNWMAFAMKYKKETTSRKKPDASTIIASTNNNNNHRLNASKAPAQTEMIKVKPNKKTKKEKQSAPTIPPKEKALTDFTTKDEVYLTTKNGDYALFYCLCALQSVAPKFKALSVGTARKFGSIHFGKITNNTRCNKKMFGDFLSAAGYRNQKRTVIEPKIIAHVGGIMTKNTKELIETFVSESTGDTSDNSDDKQTANDDIADANSDDDNNKHLNVEDNGYQEYSSSIQENECEEFDIDLLSESIKHNKFENKYEKEHINGNKRKRSLKDDYETLEYTEQPTAKKFKNNDGKPLNATNIINNNQESDNNDDDVCNGITKETAGMKCNYTLNNKYDIDNDDTSESTKTNTNYNKTKKRKQNKISSADKKTLRNIKKTVGRDTYIELLNGFDDLLSMEPEVACQVFDDIVVHIKDNMILYEKYLEEQKFYETNDIKIKVESLISTANDENEDDQNSDSEDETLGRWMN